jgi:hypothetical protein
LSRSRTLVGRLAGCRVGCTTCLARCLEEFEQVCLQLDEAVGGVDAAYELGAEADGRFRVMRDGREIAATPHAANLVVLVQMDLRSVVEQQANGRGLWIHAAGLQAPGGGGVLLVGAASAGKSTAALLLCRSGWRLSADDAVWLVPGRGFRGLGWAIGLAEPSVAVELLRAEGFRLHRQVWFHSESERTERWCINPPATAIANPAHWLVPAGIGFLERGPGAVRSLTAGEMIVRLWPQRIARADGTEPWAAAELADALARVPAAVIQSTTPQQAHQLIQQWAAALPATD